MSGHQIQNQIEVEPTKEGKMRRNEEVLRQLNLLREKLEEEGKESQVHDTRAERRGKSKNRQRKKICPGNMMEE